MSPVAAEGVAPTPSEVLSDGVDRAIDHALSLPSRRRAFVSLGANSFGWEGMAGWRFLEAQWVEGAFGAWAGAPWEDPLDPLWGAKVEVRF